VTGDWDGLSPVRISHSRSDISDNCVFGFCDWTGNERGSSAVGLSDSLDNNAYSSFFKCNYNISGNLTPFAKNAEK
jgi:hypothetical protein